MALPSNTTGELLIDVQPLEISNVLELRLYDLTKAMKALK